MKYLISLSNDEATDATISLLSAIILKINGNSTKSISSKIKLWGNKALPFLRKFGIAASAGRYINKFVLRGIFTEEDAVNLALIFKEIKKDYTKDLSISHAQLDLLNACVQNLHKNSDSSWNKIIKNIKLCNDPDLCDLYNDDSSLEINGLSFKDAHTKLKGIVKTLNGGTNLFIPWQELRTLAETKSKQVAIYRELIKIINSNIKHELRKFVRQKKTKLVSIEEVRSHFLKIGLPNNLPIGFVGGQFDEDGKAYTAEGKLLDKIPVGKVEMNPKYDPATDKTYVMSDISNKAIRYRTIVFLSNRKKLRHSLVTEFISDEDSLRAKWLADLNKANSEDQILAALVEIMYSTAARIGDVGNNSGGQPTYGLTTLLVDHVKFRQNAVLFDYVGKKLAPQPAKYVAKSPETKKVVEIIKKLIEGKSGNDYVFSFRKHRISRQIVSAYLKEKGIQLTPHGFRRIAGTKLAIALLAKAPFKKAEGPLQLEVERWFKQEALKIGEVLHHRSGEKVTSATAIKSYIDPQVVEEYFINLGLRRPKWLPMK